MPYTAIATDYDGTLAQDGRVDDRTCAALQRARAAGLRLLLVTGRELDDLSRAFAHMAVFDRIVAENGAVIWNPATAELRLLAAPPPPPLLQRLADAGVPISAGHTVIATAQTYEVTLADAIGDLGLDWEIVLNKGSVMALPAGVNKATGLEAALEDLRIDATETIGIGDAENDEVLLAACGLGVAVANALPGLKAVADLVMTGARGAGVAEVIEQVLSGSLDRDVRQRVESDADTTRDAR